MNRLKIKIEKEQRQVLCPFIQMNRHIYVFFFTPRRVRYRGEKSKDRSILTSSDNDQRILQHAKKNYRRIYYDDDLSEKRRFALLVDFLFFPFSFFLSFFLHRLINIIIIKATLLTESMVQSQLIFIFLFSARSLCSVSIILLLVYI